MRPLLAAAAAAGGRAGARLPASTVAGARRGIAVSAARGSGIAGARRRTAGAPLGGGSVQAQTRAFSVGGRRMEEVFDPATVERESDEVDVCIVGGGMCCSLP